MWMGSQHCILISFVSFVFVMFYFYSLVWSFPFLFCFMLTIFKMASKKSKKSKLKAGFFLNSDSIWLNLVLFVVVIVVVVYESPANHKCKICHRTWGTWHTILTYLPKSKYHIVTFRNFSHNYLIVFRYREI